MLIKHIYQNHHIDNLRWNYYKPRNDDIIISSGFKAGTTWIQMIIIYLIFQNKEIQWPLENVSPWIELTWHPIEKVINRIESQNHRRFLKTHLSLDGIPYYPGVKYIIIARDIRDIAMSLWNHYSNYTDKIYNRFSTLPRCPDNIHDFWHNLMIRGWFEWEIEGYPFWGIMNHLKTWWEFSGLDNILFVHYNDLLDDLKMQVIRISEFLDILVSKDNLQLILDNTSFMSMKKSGKVWQNPLNTWKDGNNTFFFKGTNGRWKKIIMDKELIEYERTAKKLLHNDCKFWLEGILETSKILPR